MYMIAEVSQYVAVASFAEAWIEIMELQYAIDTPERSPPSRRRGLKYDFIKHSINPFYVASFAEAWIEIAIPSSVLKSAGRLLRGGVD